MSTGQLRSPSYSPDSTNVPPEKTSTLAVLLRSRSSEIVTIVKELVKELRINISIDIGFEEGEKSDLAVLGSELLQSVHIANPPLLQEI